MAQTVLVVDDSPTIQNKAKGILMDKGLQVVTMSNGVAAIKKLPQVKPSVILADVSMPGKDGYEVCEFVKNSPELRHIPVVLIFSDADPYNEEQGTRVRADGTVKKMAAGKPFDPEELISTVTKFLARAEASAPKPAPPAPVITPPQPGGVTEPVDEEPQYVPRKELDVSSLTGEVAFSEPAGEGVAAGFSGSAPPLAQEPRMQDQAFAMSEPALEPGAPAAEPPPYSAEPVFIEEPTAQAPEPELPRAPTADRTMLFRVPAHIAEPVLSDELTPASASPEPPLAPPEPEQPPVAATTLESYSLTDAATGQVRFAPPEAGVTPEPEWAAEPPAPVLESPYTGAPALPFDANLVYFIVQKVVVRMAPPALSPQTIEDIARRLTSEILAELSSEPS